MKFFLCSITLLASSISSAAIPVNGWYSSAFGGYAGFPGNLNKSADALFFNGVSYTRASLFFSDLSYESGFNAGARLGYQCNPLRYELEYTYLQANLKHFKIIHIPQLGVSGRSNANVGMANIYYDFPDLILPDISPFIGGGIGYAYIHTSLGSIAGLAPPFEIISLSKNRGAFTYQGTVGLTYNFAENWGLNAAYRYLATTSSQEFGRSFQAQMGDVGIVYRFDQATYK